MPSAGATLQRNVADTCRAACGFASLSDVDSGQLEDTMESFFLSETSKYLFLLFSNATGLADHYVLSTEGHLFPPFYMQSGTDSSSSSSSSRNVGTSSEGSGNDGDEADGLGSCASEEGNSSSHSSGGDSGRSSGSSSASSTARPQARSAWDIGLDQYVEAKCASLCEDVDDAAKLAAAAARSAAQLSAALPDVPQQARRADLAGLHPCSQCFTHACKLAHARMQTNNSTFRCPHAYSPHSLPVPPPHPHPHPPCRPGHTRCCALAAVLPAAR
jgi:hypothetical protein